MVNTNYLPPTEPIIPPVLLRRGELEHLANIPEDFPNGLHGIDWPQPYAERIKTATMAAEALFSAHAAWVEAHEEFQDVAPAVDQKALEDALRAGKADPGTPNTDKADRAEHVAWTRLGLALDDARANTAKAVIADYLRSEKAHLAAYELERQASEAEAQRKCDEFTAKVWAEFETKGPAGGRASAIMQNYIASHQLEDDDFLHVGRSDDSPERKRAIAERNAAILARWKRQANSEPEPTYDITTAKATELGAAVAHGSKQASAELSRRRSESRKA